MNKKFILSTMVVLFISNQAFSQELVENFETGEVTCAKQLVWHTPADMSGGVEENPRPDEVNPSEAVFMAKRLTANQDNFWTGFYMDLKTDFVGASQTYSRIQLKYFRTSAFSTIRIKLNGAGEEFDPVEAPVKVGEWEVLEFDYRSRGFAQVENLDIRPDWRPDGNVEEGTMIYIDDITLVGEAEPIPFDGAIDDFEDANVFYWFPVTDANVFTQIVDNPTSDEVNSSSQVMEVVKTKSAELWEGVMRTGLTLPLGTGEGEFNYLHMKVLKPVLSEITVVFKKDDSDEEFPVRMTNTKTNEWEYLVFEVGQLNGNYNVLFIQPEKTEGQTEDITLYIDDILLSNDKGPDLTNISTSSMTSSNISVTGNEITVSESGRIQIYSVTGALVRSLYVEDNTTISLDRGLYLIKLGDQTTKIIIR